MNQEPSAASRVHGLAGRIAHAFIDSKLTPLVVVASVLLGAFAILMLPREDEPQIRVPMMDVMISMPGSSASEVEERATRPMEKLLWEVPGVEYLYSQSREGEALTIVRFKVGSDPDASLVKVSEKLRANQDRMPHGVAFPLIKPRSIDDVPILALTFHSALYDHLTLRRLVSQVDDAVKQGRVLLSSGAFARVSVDGKGMGDTVAAQDGAVEVSIRVEAVPEVDVDLVKVVANCDEVLAIVALPQPVLLMTR